MNKILVLVEKEIISFSKYNRSISEENLNNTNVINVKNLKFTEEYILENLELISTFLNLVTLKFKIEKIIIKNMEIAETVLKVLKKMNSIKSIKFIEDRELSYTISSLLLENNNLEKIECYNLPEIMFYRFDSDKIKTRGKILSSSNFLKYNNINTYSELYNKQKIIINEYLSESDVDDITYFLSTNINLKKIELKRYSSQNLITILNFLKKNNLKNILIVIYENQLTTDDILKDVKLFDKLNKKYNVKIKIKYSKEYKEKNNMKELNIVLFRNILIGCILSCILIFCLYKMLENKDKKGIEDNIQKIEEKINESIAVPNVEESGMQTEEENSTYHSSYYTDYSKVYEELLTINSDTVGWLTVNNTNINYPVVQTIDNEYYLDHAYDNSKNIAGWLFVDYRNDMNNISQNTIIYGHSQLKGNLMFTSLEKVLDGNWYNNQNNLNINFSIKDKDYTWKIFSIYTIEETNDYLYTNFESEEEYTIFLEKIKNRSIKDFDIEVNSLDKVLTLSTCYKDDDHRVVVHAKLVNN